MRLFLAEKKELAEAIVKALSNGQSYSKNTMYFIYKNDCITWLGGHILKLKDPEDYDPKYKDWNLDHLPLNFPNWEYDLCPIPGKEKRLQKIKELVLRAEEIVHAGDPDDEGQLLVDEVLIYFHNNKPVKRLLTNDNTPTVIRKRLQEMKDNNLPEYVGSRNAAAARRIADAIHGLNFSRFYSLALKTRGLAVGRVQTPTLGLVVKRDYEIDNHIKKKYYVLDAVIDIDDHSIKLRYYPTKEFMLETGYDDNIFTDTSFLNQLKSEIKGTNQLLTITKRKITEVPPLPFNLAKLEAEAEKRFGYSPAITDQATQTLRDQYSAITYNRTTSRYLNDEQYEISQDVLEHVFSKTGDKYPVDFNIKSKAFNSKSEAHIAIIPQLSDKDWKIDDLTTTEKNIYLLIVEYYIMQFLPPVLKEETSAKIDLPSGQLKVTYNEILNLGYKKFFHQKNEEVVKNPLANILPGTINILIMEVQIKEKHTTPPKAFSQGGLVTAMTNIAKYVENKDIAKILREKDRHAPDEHGSIGTAATRTKHISRLMELGYIKVDEKGKVHSTQRGKEIFNILPKEIKGVDTTAKWYLLQEEIRKGKEVETLKKSVLTVVNHYIKKDYSNIEFRSKQLYENEVVGKCLKCNSDVQEINIKNKKTFYACSNKECDFKLWNSYKYFDQDLKLTTAKVKNLLSCNKRAVFKLKGKSGNEYKRYFSIVFNGQYINLEAGDFVNKKKKSPTKFRSSKYK